MEWISVKDILPKNGQVFLTYCSSAERDWEVCVCKMIDGKICDMGNDIWNEDYTFWDVTHWMPLPEPPKSKQ